MQDTTNGIIYAAASNQIAAYIHTSSDNPDDLSQCSEDITLLCTNYNVDLCDTNFSTVKTLKFKEGAKVYLCYSENLPETIDVSMCDNVYLNGTNLSTVKSLKFKEGAEVDLSGCLNLPADLDVSMCNQIYLNGTDLSTIKTLEFKEGASGELTYSENLPETLDVSMCDNIILFKAGLSQTQTLTFKNKQQQQNSNIAIPADWSGKIIYTDEQPPQNGLNKIISRSTTR